MIQLTKGKWADKKGKKAALVIEGVSLLKNGKWNGMLSRKDELGHRWLRKNADRIPLAIFADKQPVAEIIFENPKSKITSEIRNGKVIFNIKLRVSGTIISMSKDTAESFLSSEAEKLIQKEVRRTYMEGLKHDADVLNLLDSLYRKKNREWHRITSIQEFPLKPDSLQNIDVKVKISNSGRMTSSFPEN